MEDILDYDIYIILRNSNFLANGSNFLNYFLLQLEEVREIYFYLSSKESNSAQIVLPRVRDPPSSAGVPFYPHGIRWLPKHCHHT